uniref:Uncharacterized protein n=1 Tax=Steinernema glaseri TaxID=37863 RepID=A0A1I7Z9S2_9BILA
MCFLSTEPLNNCNKGSNKCYISDKANVPASSPRLKQRLCSRNKRVESVGNDATQAATKLHTWGSKQLTDSVEQMTLCEKEE